MLSHCPLRAVKIISRFDAWPRQRESRAVKDITDSYIRAFSLDPQGLAQDEDRTARIKDA